MSVAVTIGAFAVIVVVSYFLGAIPFSFIIGKLWGVDVRKEGSGNVGMTNVMRTAGKVPGVIAFILDSGKGAAAAVITYFSMAALFGPGFPRVFVVVSAVAAVIGHIFPVFLRFKGGKGVATAAGAMFVLTPVPLCCALVAFAAGLLLSKRTVSVGSTVAAIAFPLFVLLFYFVPALEPAYNLFFNHRAQFSNFAALLIASIFVCLTVIATHIPNYKRLAKGEEKGFATSDESKSNKSR